MFRSSNKSFVEKATFVFSFCSRGKYNKKCHAHTETILILATAQTIFFLSQVQNLFAGLTPLQCNTMKSNTLTLLGLFSINSNICMTSTSDHARKIKSIRSEVNTNMSVCCHAGGQDRFRKVTVLGIQLLNIYPRDTRQTRRHFPNLCNNFVCWTCQVLCIFKELRIFGKNYELLAKLFRIHNSFS